MPKQRILLVDDLPEMLLITKKSLESSGEDFEIQTAENGEVAIEKMQRWVPDLIITDWDMPRLDGIGLTSYIRKHPSFSDIPIMMITGLMVTPRDLKLAFDVGTSDFLRKPFDKTELIARVKSMLLAAKAIYASKALNEMLMEHNRFVTSLFSAVPSPLVYYNTEGLIISCNESFQKIWGNNTAIGNEVFRIFHNPEQIKAQSLEMVHNNIKQMSFEVAMKDTDKIESTYLVTKTIFCNPQQKVEGIICLFSDISKLKSEHGRNIERKRKELVSSAMRLMQMSEMNDRLIYDLDRLETHSDTDGKQIISDLKAKYNLKSTNSAWKEFELRFEKVYEDFYERLLKIHSDLTPSEKKLCALLKLNLSSKEIAALTYQDAKSVDMARYRLRKKLNLSQDENLIDYLLNI